MTRPLLVIFLTIVVNLVGFGIIIPLLPFYAQTFGASPLVIGLLFASYSISQLIASPVLGHWSDSWGRRPVLLLSLIGTVVSFAMLALATSLTLVFLSRIIDGLSGGNITTARAYVADVTREEDRARAYGLIGAAFGLGFIVGPALAGVLVGIAYTAPIWAAVGLTMVAVGLAWRWLPETVHRVEAAAPSFRRALPTVLRRASLRPLLGIDFFYWTTFAVYQTSFALFGAARFGLDAAHIGYILSAFGGLAVVVQVALVGPVVQRFGEQRTLVVGLALAAVGLGSASVSYTIIAFLAALVPVGIGAGLSIPALISLLSRSAGPGDQGSVQGVAAALESLGRTVGPIWGNGALQRFGEGTAYGSAAIVLGLTALAAALFHVSPPSGSIERPE